jgi:hypothetical protein
VQCAGGCLQVAVKKALWNLESTLCSFVVKKDKSRKIKVKSWQLAVCSGQRK